MSEGNPIEQHHESIDWLIARVCKLHYGRVHALLAELGLYRGQPPMLRALWEEDGLTHRDLSERLRVQPATITKMAQRMERAGFVERRADPNDQRVSRVYLTEAGRDVQTRVEQIWRVIDEETLAGFDDGEREELRGFLSRMRENLAAVYDGEPRHQHGRRDPGGERRHHHGSRE
ncbi:MAG: MarR family winged helix-turn-helix transcriptional regulator [Anaerolineae bacterium]